MAKRDDYNYPVGISSGMRTGENLVYGLAGKAAGVITSGVNFVQVDVQNISEFAEPEFIRRLKRTIEQLQMRWGMHGEITANMQFDNAEDKWWTLSHIQLNKYLDYFYEYFSTNKEEVNKPGSRKMFPPEYVDFHISITDPIRIRTAQGQIQGASTVTPWGRDDWFKFFEEHGEKVAERKGKMSEVKEWFKSNMMKFFVERQVGVPDPFEYVAGKWYERLGLPELDARRGPAVLENLRRAHASAQSDEERRRLEADINNWIRLFRIFRKAYAWWENPKIGRLVVREGDQEVILSERIYNTETELIEDEEVREFLEFVYDFWAHLGAKVHKRGAIIGEEYAYALIAKYIEVCHPTIWKNFARGHSNMKDILKALPGEQYRQDSDFLITRYGHINLHPFAVAMVSALYIYGHFQTPIYELDRDNYVDTLERMGLKNAKEGVKSFYKLNPIEKLQELKIRIAFENPHFGATQEQQLNPGAHRLIRAMDMVAFAKTAEKYFKDPNCPLKLLFDPAWYIANGLDALKEIQTLSEGDGRHYIAVQLHGVESGQSHETIDLGSDYSVYVYKALWELQKRGMIKAPLVFERGGGQNPQAVVKQTVFVMRKIADGLIAETAPADLGKDFFGFDSAGYYSEERQRTAVKEHALDPLKGFMVIPEEDWTFLSGRARDLQKTEEWKKARLR